jgi:hypothetical protein
VRHASVLLVVVVVVVVPAHGQCAGKARSQ